LAVERVVKNPQINATDLLEDQLNVAKEMAIAGTDDEVARHLGCCSFCGFHGRDSFLRASQEVDVPPALNDIFKKDTAELNMQHRCLYHLLNNPLQKTTTLPSVWGKYKGVSKTFWTESVTK
jgi:hypothetical protein